MAWPAAPFDVTRIRDLQKPRLYAALVETRPFDAISADEMLLVSYNLILDDFCADFGSCESWDNEGLCNAAEGGGSGPTDFREVISIGSGDDHAKFGDRSVLVANGLAILGRHGAQKVLQVGEMPLFYGGERQNAALVKHPGEEAVDLPSLPLRLDVPGALRVFRDQLFACQDDRVVFEPRVGVLGICRGRRDRRRR